MNWRLEEHLLVAKGASMVIDRRGRHVSIVADKKNRIISLGTNIIRTHPLAVKLGYRIPVLHAETDAWNSLRRSDKARSRDLFLLSYRFSRHMKTSQIQVLMAKPCPICMAWCASIFKEILWTENEN